MGIAEERFVDAASIPEDFACTICQEVFDEPFGTPCQHVFCKECIIAALRVKEECPICRATVRERQLRKNTFAANLVGKMKVYCENRSVGCPWNGNYEAYAAHQSRDCLFERVSCPFDGCSEKPARKDFVAHMGSCRYRTQACEFCRQVVRQEDLKVHLAVCERAPIRCPHGCGRSVPQKDMESHFRECPRLVVAISLPSGKKEIVHLSDYVHPDDVDDEDNDEVLQDVRVGSGGARKESPHEGVAAVQARAQSLTLAAAKAQARTQAALGHATRAAEELSRAWHKPPSGRTSESSGDWSVSPPPNGTGGRGDGSELRAGGAHMAHFGDIGANFWRPASAPPTSPPSGLSFAVGADPPRFHIGGAAPRKEKDPAQPTHVRAYERRREQTKKKRSPRYH